MTDKKRRGRPAGTGIDDEAVLNRIADLIVRQSGLKATTAFKRVRRKPSPAEIRRIQAKWKESKAGRLASAEARLAAERAPRPPLSARGVGSGAGIPDTLRAHVANIEAMRRAMDSPALRLARDLENSPVMRLAREMQNSPVMRLARDLQDSPIMRAARALEDSPVMTMARRLAESPVMKAVEQQRQMIDRLTRFGRI